MATSTFTQLLSCVDSPLPPPPSTMLYTATHRLIDFMLCMQYFTVLGKLWQTGREWYSFGIWVVTSEQANSLGLAVSFRQMALKITFPDRLHILLQDFQ